MFKVFSRELRNAIQSVHQRQFTTTFLSFKTREVTIGPFSRRAFHSDSVESPRLSPQQVSSYIRTFETSFEGRGGAVKSFDGNKLAANNPIEDRSSEAIIELPEVLASQYLFGVFDGHAGCACAQAVKERLFSYIALRMAPLECLEKIKNGKLNPRTDILNRFPHRDDYPLLDLDMTKHVEESLLKFSREILSHPAEDSTHVDHLKEAFLRLDHDIVFYALPGSLMNQETLSVAFSGACACVALLDEVDLYVANAGDCQAVLGVAYEDDQWEAVSLSSTHGIENNLEVERITREHPNEANILRGGRLLGDLAPLRAFGDARYKWQEKDMQRLLNVGSHKSDICLYDALVPNHYLTPPYLTAEPEVVHHRLTPRDKFLVIASDGLWEFIDPEEVVKLVAGHMDGKQVLSKDFRLPTDNMLLGDLNTLLKKRKSKLAKRPIDQNVATHLLRNALGPEHGKVSQLLTLPEDVARLYRDDITVTVIFFDTEYITNTAFAKD